MKLNAIIIAVCLSVMILPVHGQEYKIPSANVARLEIREVNRISIEGHNGADIIFRLEGGKLETDERAQGLRAISSMGLEDNTGLGLSSVRKGNVVEVRQLKKMDGPRVKILVPKSVAIVYEHTSPYGNDIAIRNFEGAVNISTVHNGVELNNVTGAVRVKVVHGDVDAIFTAPPSQEVSLESVHGHVDAALPQAAKADLTLASGWGEVMVDPDFKIEFARSGELVNLTDKIQGKLNGGGPAITLSAQHSNVYLRKK